MRWFPQTISSGGSWYNPRHDYHNDVRLNLTATNVVETQVAYSGFTKGTAKIAFMPEFFNGELFTLYEGTIIYVEIKYQPNQLLVFDLVRQWGAGENDRQWVAWANDVPYVPGQTVSFQVGGSTARIYYGTNLLINASHGANAVQVYANGAFPHLEFQNRHYTTDATVLINSVQSRELSGFTSP